MVASILLCCDLDRTLIPNGEAPEHPLARPLLRAVAARPEITLAFVSGRSRELQQSAIVEWALPRPEFAIADVGTSLYEIGDEWRLVETWHREIAGDWRGLTGPEVATALGTMPGLRLQGPEGQGVYKLSYFAELERGREGALGPLQERIGGTRIEATVVWSIDEALGVGLVDVVPRRATKAHAERFLTGLLGRSEDRVVFAGDSGNDLEALVSGLPAVLVRNASDEVRSEAVARAAAAGRADRLHLATGGFLGLDGCYAAGVIEGLAHFHPELEPLLERLAVKASAAVAPASPAPPGRPGSP